MSFCPETNTLAVIGPLDEHAVRLGQLMCAPTDVLAIVSILDRPENYVLGYIAKRHIEAFVADQERVAVERGWAVHVTVYDGFERVVEGVFDGLAWGQDRVAN